MNHITFFGKTHDTRQVAPSGVGSTCSLYFMYTHRGLLCTCIFSGINPTSNTR